MPIASPRRVLAIPGAGSLAAIRKSPRPPWRDFRPGISAIGGRCGRWRNRRRWWWALPGECHRGQPAGSRKCHDLPGCGARRPRYARAMEEIEVRWFPLQPGGIGLLPDDVVVAEWLSGHHIRGIGGRSVEVDPPGPALRRARANAIF